MASSVEKKDLLAVPVGAYLSYEVGRVCAGETDKIYWAAIELIGAPQREFRALKEISKGIVDAVSATPSAASARMLAIQAKSLSDNNGWMSDLVDLVADRVQVSQQSGVQSALWVGCIETFTSFLFAWRRNESKHLALCVLDGGARGAVIALSVEKLGGSSNDKALRMLTAGVVGFVTGMFAAGIGTVAGWGANRLFQKIEGRPVV